MRPKYMLQSTDMSFCPDCKSNVDLLCTDGDSLNTTQWFYICWKCKRVYQLGKGEVPHV